MSAGVIVLDHNFRLIGCNDVVSRVLRHDLAPYIGKELSDVDGMETFSTALTKAFSEFAAQTAGSANPQNLHWQKQIEIPRDTAEDSGHETGSSKNENVYPAGTWIVSFCQ